MWTKKELLERLEEADAAMIAQGIKHGTGVMYAERFGERAMCSIGALVYLYQGEEKNFRVWIDKNLGQSMSSSIMSINDGVTNVLVGNKTLHLDHGPKRPAEVAKILKELWDAE